MDIALSIVLILTQISLTSFMPFRPEDPLAPDARFQMLELCINP